MPAYQCEEGPAAAASVGHQIPRVELASGEPGLGQYIGRSLNVVDITCADICRYGKFAVLAAGNQQVELIPIDHLLIALRARFDRPSGLGVRLWRFTSITPGLQCGAIQSYSLPKARQNSVVLPDQSARHVLNQMQVLPTRQLCKESGEGTLVRDVIRRKNTAGLSDERVIPEYPNHSVGRLDAHDVFSYEAAPQNLGRMPFGATATRANEHIKERPIAQSCKNAFKLCDDGRLLNRRSWSGKIGSSHGKLIPSSRLGVVGGCAPAAPSAFRTSVLWFRRIVNSLSRIFVINILALVADKCHQCDQADQLRVLAGGRCRYPSLAAATDRLYNVKSPMDSSVGCMGAGRDVASKLDPAGSLFASRYKKSPVCRLAMEHTPAKTATSALNEM